MPDKYMKEIAKELRLIRIEMQRQNGQLPKEVETEDGKHFRFDELGRPERVAPGERVTIE